MLFIRAALVVAPALCFCCFLFASGEARAVQRAFVASYGLDANTATNCDATQPCRFFQAASTVVDPGGEIVALDSAGYGVITITQSLSIVAPDGVYAGISVFPGASGVTINTPGVKVVLRGLTINSQGGDNGVNMTNGASLSVERCVISGFQNGNLPLTGIQVATAAKVSITNTTLSKNFTGISIREGASAIISKATVVESKLYGMFFFNTTPNTTTNVVVTDSIIAAGEESGVIANSQNPTAGVRVAIMRSTISGNVRTGLVVRSLNGAPVTTTLSKSMVKGNQVGFLQLAAGSVLESLGNNVIRQNASSSSGTLTTVPRI